ncbi:hypothetical protein ACRYI5_07635 [Furfurilactobacillus sp. WILCCON 0119]
MIFTRQIEAMILPLSVVGENECEDSSLIRIENYAFKANDCLGRLDEKESGSGDWS